MQAPIQLVVMGKMAAGKTTASNYLVDDHGATAWTIAERIKQVAYALVGHSGNLGDLLNIVLQDNEHERLATKALLVWSDSYVMEVGKPRRLFQEVGQILRDLSPQTVLCWEEDLQRRISIAEQRCTVVDIRSKESYGFFVAQGYSTLRIDAPLDIRKQRLLMRDKHEMLDDRVFSHQSETDVDCLSFQFTIDNSSDDPTALYAELDAVIEELATPVDETGM